MGTYCDPVPGYSDSLLGPLALGYGTMTGLFRVIFKPRDVCPNFVAADITVNSILVVAMKTARVRDENAKIFNIVGERHCKVSHG